MIRRAALLALVAIAMFAVQAGDCTGLLAANQQSMACCGSMPCHPGHGFHECCKTKVSPPHSTMMPRDNAALSLSCAPAAGHLLAADIAVDGAANSEFAAPQHSPPEIYTLYSSFRI